MTRIVNERTVELIKHFESLHDGDLSKIGLQPKRCPAGVWTIGYGHALRDARGTFLRGAEMPDITISERAAEHLLADDLIDFSGRVDALVKVPLTDNQFGALVSLMYNIGEGAFEESTALKRLNAGDYEGAAKAMQWFRKGGGKVLKGLVLRRKAEAALFEDRNGGVFD